MKTTFSFDEHAVRLLSNLAEKKNTSKAEVIRRALMLYDFMEKQRGDRSEFTVINKDGKELHLILP